MKTIRFNATIPRYAFGLAMGKFFPKLLWSGLSCTYLADVPEPQLPAEDWIIIQTRYGGICGSDMATIYLETSPYYSPFSSFPFSFGHENTGKIAQVGPGVPDWKTGERVVVEPLLWCQPRGFNDLCRYCARGEINRCERSKEGRLAAGLSIGFCRDTEGSWSAYFPAHATQVYRVPGAVNDENALLVEPFAVGLHAVLQNPPQRGDTVLIIGAGTIGLCTLAALRALDCESEVLVLARHSFQAEAARRLGASHVITTGSGDDFYVELARLTGARLLKPMIGKRVPEGGVDATFECTGKDSAIDDALRFTRAGGRVVLVGVPGIAKGIDWTPIFAKELDVRAANTYHHNELFEGKRWRTYDLALHLLEMGKVDLSWLVTHRFRIEEYRQALAMQSRLGANRSIKSVFSYE